jgi:hypothetical protein
MSMNEDEISSSKLACKNDYKNLDFVPLIEVRPRTGSVDGTGRCDCRPDAESRALQSLQRPHLLGEAGSGVEHVLLLRDSVEPGQHVPPLIYSDEERIYIIERPQPSVSVRMTGIARMIQNETYNLEEQGEVLLGSRRLWARTGEVGNSRGSRSVRLQREA